MTPMIQVLTQTSTGLVCCRQAIALTEMEIKSPLGVSACTKRCLVVQGLLREAFSREWEAYPEQEAAEAWKHLEAPATTRVLGAVLDRLSGGKRARL